MAPATVDVRGRDGMVGRLRPLGLTDVPRSRPVGGGHGNFSFRGIIRGDEYREKTSSFQVCSLFLAHYDTHLLKTTLFKFLNSIDACAYM